MAPCVGAKRRGAEAAVARRPGAAVRQTMSAPSNVLELSTTRVSASPDGGSDAIAQRVAALRGHDTSRDGAIVELGKTGAIAPRAAPRALGGNRHRAAPRALGGNHHRAAPRALGGNRHRAAPRALGGNRHSDACTMCAFDSANVMASHVTAHM
eukprot:352468-Chlamydomonas_euryale.AAC.2